LEKWIADRDYFSYEAVRMGGSGIISICAKDWQTFFERYLRKDIKESIK